MSSDAATRLDALTEIAGRLAEVYGALAEQTEDRREGLRWFRVFDRAFFAFRVGLALKLRFARTAQAAAREEREDEPEERLEVERPDAPERLDDTDRDRDTERASFPLLLKSLGALVTEAEALPGPHPAELGDLKALLAQTSPPPCGEGPGVGAPAQRPKAGATKAALLNSARTPLPQPFPARGRGSVIIPARRATGPPRR